MNIYEILLGKLKLNIDAVVCTIINSEGSVPRKKGASMLVCKDDEIFGTIGGGVMEFNAVNLAKRLLIDKKSYIESYSLNSNAAADIGMICGGRAEIFFRYVSKENLEFLEKALSENREGEKLVTKIKKDFSWEWSFAEEKDFKEYSNKDEIIFSERIRDEIKVYIFGGGHVSIKAASLLSNVDFKVTVYEDRPEFARKENFPSAEDVILGDFRNISENVNITKNDFVLIMTRGHQYDYEVLLQVMKKECAYIGVIGSRKKAYVTRERLKKAGFSEEDVNAIHSPVGLSIKAETPAEIAVSIVSEMILERAYLK